MDEILSNLDSNFESLEACTKKQKHTLMYNRKLEFFVSPICAIYGDKV